MRTLIRPAMMIGFLLIQTPSLAQENFRAPSPIDRTLVPYASMEDTVRLGDGRTIHMVCMGQGSPTVILTAGAGDWSGTWRQVQPEVAKTTRVCAWDRAGFGLSSPPVSPQTAGDSAADLTEALRTTSALQGPYVLVGHSGGAFESLLFADQQKPSVVGMVLVDPAFPDESERMARASPGEVAYMAAQPDPLGTLLRKCSAALRAGKLRPGDPDPDGCLAPHWPASDPPELIAARQQMLAEATPQTIAGAMENMLAGNLEMLSRNSKITINPSRDYGEMPLIVLTRTIFVAPPDYPAAAQAEIPAAEAEWNKGHDELAALSSRGVNARIPGSEHYIHGSKPQVVIDAIEQVIREARDERH